MMSTHAIDRWVELLQRRRLCSGTVHVLTNGDILRFEGDNAANVVGLNSAGESGMFVTIGSSDGTNVVVDGKKYNGDSFSLSRFKAIVVELGAGDNTFDTGDFDVPGNFDFSGEGGNDRLELDDTHFAGDVSAKGLGGTDRFTLSHATIDGDVLIEGGAGHDRTSAEETSIGGDWTIADRQSGTSVFVSECAIGARLDVRTGNATDSLEIDQTNGSGSATITLAGGNDVLILNSDTFTGGRLIDVGLGDNRIIET